VTAWFWGAIAAAEIAVFVGVFTGWMLAMWDSRPPRGGYPSSPVPLDRMPRVPAGPANPPVTPRRHVCMDCSHLQDIDADGRLAIHNRPEPWVPFDYGSIPCTGSGRTP
jgi:hypothetical protein